MQDALILSGFLIALIAIFFGSWFICTAAVAVTAMLKGENVNEAIAPWLAEL